MDYLLQINICYYTQTCLRWCFWSWKKLKLYHFNLSIYNSEQIVFKDMSIFICKIYFYMAVKASFSFPQIITKITQAHALYISLSFYISLSYIIIVEKNNSVKHSHQVRMVIWRGRKYSSRAHRDTQKFIYSYKQVSGRNGDLEWYKITNVFILCDLLLKVQNKTYSKQRRNGKQKEWMPVLTWSSFVVSTAATLADFSTPPNLIIRTLFYG